MLELLYVLTNKKTSLSQKNEGTLAVVSQKNEGILAIVLQKKQRISALYSSKLIFAEFVYIFFISNILLYWL